MRKRKEKLSFSQECEKIITVIKNLIESGREEELRRNREDEDKKNEIEKKFEFLDGFYERHKKEFEENGFGLYPPYFDTSFFFRPKHPLFGAYNDLLTDLYYMKERRNPRFGQMKFYKIDEIYTTGDVSYTDLSSMSGLTKASVKFVLDFLEGSGKISKKSNESGSKYYYWINEETTQNGPKIEFSTQELSP